eukprot:TRINITY_DN7359_c0_g4_i3.p1 TRINITY_DN7359_c0_g4~~TRINITY_DN7359_c0_g4_i3.p1  ORF type:complete len:261 (-),score=50.57 TRINITY_DN7359_c0_g4_i3:24-806(-)
MCIRDSTKILCSRIYIRKQMQLLTGKFKEAKDLVHKHSVASSLLKHTAKLTLKVLAAAPQLKETSQVTLTGTLQPISGNNLEHKGLIAKEIAAALEGADYSVKVRLRVSAVGIEIPQLNAHNVDNEVVTIDGKGPILIIFWKPVLDWYPSRELAYDFLNQNKALAEKIRIISIAIHCRREQAFPQHSGIEYYWMSSASVKALKEAIPEASTGVYYYLIGDSSGKVVSAGNPQEVVLKLSLIHICRCRRYAVCRSRWSPDH